MSSPGDGMPAWWENLKGDFECPVCLESMTDAPIFQCDNPLSHSICSKCNETLQKEEKKCPVCNANLGNRRNLAMEKMVEKLPKVKCKLKGCSFEKSDGEAVKKHEENCEYRHVPCAKCDDKVPLVNIADHVNVHNGNRTCPLLKSFSTNIMKGCVGTNLVTGQCVFRVEVEVNDQLTFLSNWQVSEDGNAMYHWIAFVGPRESAKNFMYTLRVGDPNGPGRPLFEGTRVCVPCDLSHADMKKSKCCLMLDKELIQNISVVEENMRRFNFSLSIHKV